MAIDMQLGQMGIVTSFVAVLLLVGGLVSTGLAFNREPRDVADTRGSDDSVGGEQPGIGGPGDVVGGASPDVGGPDDVGAGSPPDVGGPEDPDTAVPIPVPDVVGMPLDEAVATLERADLDVGEVTEQPTGDVEPGIVMTTDPAAATAVGVSRAVNVIISTDAGPAEQSSG